ncbi:MAG: hypothetical protein ACI8YQ_003285 [Polaribacter sp.]|jgi:hypothetical protein
MVTIINIFIIHIKKFFDMKKLVLILTAVVLLCMSTFAQNNVQLNINHKLGNANFAMESPAKNNLDNDFEVTRLQYYISEITIVHDGGTETAIEDLWILADVSEATQVDLGDHDITAVEMVKLHIGVDSDYNHLDPASYASQHPLAPKFPSMHWGWAPGYRFVAFEGSGGSGFDQDFQLHGLGDVNYFTTEIPLEAAADNNEVIINIDADYTRALEDIDVNTGTIVHGDYGDAKKCLENFRDYVFAAAGLASATIDFSEVGKFEVFPNPTDGNAVIMLETSQDLNYQVAVTDILGKQVMFFDNINSNTTIDLTLEESGFYFVNLIKEGQPVITKKLISK